MAGLKLRGGVRNVRDGTNGENAECGVRNAECGVESAEGEGTRQAVSVLQIRRELRAAVGAGIDLAGGKAIQQYRPVAGRARRSHGHGDRRGRFNVANMQISR